MTLMDHLAELRRRLIVSFVAVAMGAVACWIASDRIIEFLLSPYCDVLADRDDQAECSLYITNPLEPFRVKLTVAGYGGVAAAIPVIMWQLWRFTAPGLYSREKRYAVPFVLGGVLLFFAGAALAYWSIPQALGFLLSLGGENFVEIFRPSEYLGFVIKMIVAFGIGFEFPIVLIFLQLLGLVDNRALRRARRYALVGIVAGVAVITPSGDPFTLIVLSVPMYGFYEISILFGLLRARRAARAERAHDRPAQGHRVEGTR